MTLKEQIISDFKQAFKEKDLVVKSVLSLLQSEIKNKEIELGKRDEGLSDEEVIQIIGRSIKQRKEAISQFTEGGREELADGEKKELEILQKYFPTQMGSEKIEKEVKAVIEETGATSKADMGKVMGQVMARLKGKADGTTVREMVDKLLS